jgi:para-nitrobenzyl esterase
MTLSPKWLAGLVALTLAACAVTPTSTNPLHITTKQGIVAGADADGIRTFKGIPYAAPPVGPLRWKPPQAPAKWSGVRDATRFGPPCPTFDTTYAQAKRMSGLGYDIFSGVPLAPGSTEDCLTLDVWAPKTARNAPVMVWINPLGASSMPAWDGTSFARDGVILVTFNYRQLSLGNFSHPALTKEAKADEPLGRFQTMDQLAVLKWVKENIRAFGGDDRNVTLFGLSAGGASTLQILTIPQAKGLVDKAIVQSGNGWWSPATQAEMEAIGVWMAKEAGWPANATAEQLRTLPLDNLPHFGAYSIDGRLQKENATDAFAAGRVIDVPMMIGSTDFDATPRYPPQQVIDRTSAEVKAAYAGEGKTGDDLGYQLYTDSHNGAPARWTAKMTAGGQPTYLYLWTYVRTPERGKVRGAAHGTEGAFVFDSWAKAYPLLQLSEEDKAATRMMHSCWVSFAKTGKPQCEGAPEWPRYTAEGDQLMDLGVRPKVVAGYRAVQLDAQEKAMQDVIADTRHSIEDLIATLR